MTNMQQAQAIFESGAYSCVLYRDGVTHMSTKRGVSPLVDWIRQGVNLNDFSAADKVVGKAAALLFVLAGVKEVYAQVMSEKALNSLLAHGVQATYDQLVPSIINREGTGPCPMERAVTQIDDPALALEAVEQTLAALKKAN